MPYKRERKKKKAPTYTPADPTVEALRTLMYQGTDLLAGVDESLILNKTEVQTITRHQRYIDVVQMIRLGMSGSKITHELAVKYNISQSTAVQCYYQAIKYWTSLYKQEDIMYLRYILREKYEAIMELAISKGDLRSALSALDSIRKMFSLDKTEIEVSQVVTKFKFDGIEDEQSTNYITPNEDEKEDYDSIYLPLRDEELKPSPMSDNPDQELQNII